MSAAALLLAHSAEAVTLALRSRPADVGNI